MDHASLSLDAFRALFPALQQKVWLNTAAGPPGCLPVMDALRQTVGAWQAGAETPTGPEDAAATRAQFARLIGTEPGNVALLNSLADAAATVANSLPRGRVVVGEREYRSNLFPWLALRERGWEVVEAPARDGSVDVEALSALVDERTVLVAITDVQSVNGYRGPLAALADRTRAVGGRLFVNLTQSLGALRFDVAELRPDFVASHGYKWLLGPRGAAWLYVAPTRLAEMRPLAPSPHSGEALEFYGGPYELAATAHKLDMSLSWLPWTGAQAALKVIASLDPAAVEERCLELSEHFRTGARDLGLRVARTDLPSQIVGVVLPDPQPICSVLSAAGIVTAVRGEYLRLGFHGFNNHDDVEAVLGALKRLA